jgi:hypothetical protein
VNSRFSAASDARFSFAVSIAFGAGSRHTAPAFGVTSECVHAAQEQKTHSTRTIHYRSPSRSRQRPSSSHRASPSCRSRDHFCYRSHSRSRFRSRDRSHSRSRGRGRSQSGSRSRERWRSTSRSRTSRRRRSRSGSRHPHRVCGRSPSRPSQAPPFPLRVVATSVCTLATTPCSRDLRSLVASWRRDCQTKDPSGAT